MSPNLDILGHLFWRVLCIVGMKQCQYEKDEWYVISGYAGDVRVDSVVWPGD
jgi:hypothetical protein